MEIRLLQHAEVNVATELMATNYPGHPEYREKVQREIASMFVEHPVRPQFVVALEDTVGGVVLHGAGILRTVWLSIIGVACGRLSIDGLEVEVKKEGRDQNTMP